MGFGLRVIGANSLPDGEQGRGSSGFCFVNGLWKLPQLCERTPCDLANKEAPKKRGLSEEGTGAAGMSLRAYALQAEQPP